MAHKIIALWCNGLCTFPCEGKGSGFDSHQDKKRCVRHTAQIKRYCLLEVHRRLVEWIARQALFVEWLIISGLHPEDGGSIPSRGTKKNSG